MQAEGTSAPDFQLGGFHLGQALAEGPILLVFFKIACPTCQLTMPFLKRLADGAGPGSPRLVTVSQDDAKNTGMFQQRFGPSEAPLLDAAPYPVSNLYGIRNVPSLFLIESDGAISMSVAGFSKAHIESLGARFGVMPFRESEKVPLLRPG
jgi:thiol-disulfide isomerase/thioredoxin